MHGPEVRAGPAGGLQLLLGKRLEKVRLGCCPLYFILTKTFSVSFIFRKRKGMRGFKIASKHLKFCKISIRINAMMMA